MRQFFRSSAGFIALIILGLVIGAAGTATAANLITGKDIKNGTITAKDIKPGTIGEKQLSGSVNSKLNATGTEGTQGPKGDTGATGQQGPKGDPGTNAPGGFIVKDGDGNAIDGFVSAGLLRVWDGGLWYYDWDGTPARGDLSFIAPDCTGTPFGEGGNEGPQGRLLDANGQAYKYSSTPAQTREVKSILRPDGTCVNFGYPENWNVAELVPVTAPPVLKGPLTVYANP